MNLKKNFLIVFSLSFLPSLVFAGTAHYVDCSAGTNGSGSYASPWNNISSINSHSLSTGDDVYFKDLHNCRSHFYSHYSRHSERCRQTPRKVESIKKKQ